MFQGLGREVNKFHICFTIQKYFFKYVLFALTFLWRLHRSRNTLTKKLLDFKLTLNESKEGSSQNTEGSD